jgi:hypothetical protein
MPLPHKLGTLTPVIYFRDANGHILLAPYSAFPTPEGYVREEADTLPKIDKLTDMMREQERQLLRRERMHEDALTGEARKRVYDRLTERLISSKTSEYEKDFIRAYLLLREERRERFHAKYEEFNAYFHAREFDIGNRRADEEKAP